MAYGLDTIGVVVVPLMSANYALMYGHAITSLRTRSFSR